ncbi:ATPases with chaperone activity%2C ATP-binding subunit [Streptococcus suis]|nr:ATPases with chaperone activity%2C ATP-binding subunit [Streptococcus suis]CYW72462.1 ATPases with chaperone activity%2C ATP-binding subunit [Streptococcus suis]
MKFFQKKKQNQDQFKRLIHRLSEMSDTELTKVEQLLDVVFDTNFKPDRNVELSQSVITDEEQSLDKSIQEAKNKLNTEQLEKTLRDLDKVGERAIITNNRPIILACFLKYVSSLNQTK